jgi:hypothetical protein
VYKWTITILQYYYDDHSVEKMNCIRRIRFHDSRFPTCNLGVLNPFFLNKKTLGLGHHILALPLTTIYGLPLPPGRKKKYFG